MENSVQNKSYQYDLIFVFAWDSDNKLAWFCGRSTAMFENYYKPCSLHHHWGAKPWNKAGGSTGLLLSSFWTLSGTTSQTVWCSSHPSPLKLNVQLQWLGQAAGLTPVNKAISCVNAAGLYCPLGQPTGLAFLEMSLASSELVLPSY